MNQKKDTVFVKVWKLFNKNREGGVKNRLIIYIIRCGLLLQNR